MRALRELIGALGLGLEIHLARPRHLLLIAAGFTVGGLVLVLLLAVAAGLERVGDETGAADVAIVLAANARNESDSTIRPEAMALLADLPGVAHDSDGRALIAPQFIANTKLRRVADGERATVLVRGVTASSWSMAGLPRPASGEADGHGIDGLTAGASASRVFAALDPGAQIKIRHSIWRVAGDFEGAGVWDSELWADIASLQASFNAPGALSVAWVKLESPAAFATFQSALDADKRLRDLRAEPQKSYYARQVRFVSHFVRVAAAGIGMALGFGAALAIANALTLALVARRRELAILRALGYRRGILGFALLLEALVVGALTALLVASTMRFALSGVSVESSTGSQAVSFALAVTPEVAAWALAYALMLGAISAAWPAWQAVCAPLLTALGRD